MTLVSIKYTGRRSVVQAFKVLIAPHVRYGGDRLSEALALRSRQGLRQDYAMLRFGTAPVARRPFLERPDDVVIQMRTTKLAMIGGPF